MNLVVMQIITPRMTPNKNNSILFTPIEVVYEADNNDDAIEK